MIRRSRLGSVWTFLFHNLDRLCCVLLPVAPSTASDDAPHGNNMGNEIAKKYDMDEEPSATGGLACLWKIYKATDKASGQPVSVFVFTKEDLKDVDKALREQVLVILRRELKVLEGMSSRKHPSVVRLIESFEETKKLLAFVTERVSCSLADALGEGPGSLSPQVASAARRGFERYEVARGFFGLCEGLQFVHTIRRRLHLNLAPESIFLAPSGQFKLGGFGFSVDLPSDGSSTTPCPYFQTGARSGFEGTWRLHPVMAFSSPEATAPAGSSDVSCASDMFSLGCLMYQLCRDDPRGGRLITADPTPQAHQTFCATLDYPGRVNTSALVPEVQTLVTSLIQTAPSMRPLLGNVTINPVFHGTEVTVLKTIDGIPGRNPAEAATFLTSIRPEVTGFPLRVQRDCIMQPLMDACAAEQSGRLWAFALPIVTDVCAKLDRREIVASVQAKFKPALKAQPLETLASLVSAMPLFLQKTEVAFFRSDVVPMVCRALQAQGNPQVPEAARRAVDVQEAALKAVSDEAFHGAIDGRTRELEILPRVCWLVVKGSAVRVKVNALLCLSKTFHFFQVRAVVDKVLPTLKFCAERDETVAIQLCVLGCYDAVAKRLDRLGPVATHILPACAPMLACKGLNSNQFEMAVGIVQGMLGTVIAYRRRQIANPSATAIIEKKPTHPGGVPDEVEIARQRNAVLGGWKPLSPSAAKKASGISSPLSSTFPKAPASSPPAALNVADIFSTTPASGEVASAATPSAAFSGKLSPTCSKPTPVATAAGLGNRGAGSPSGGAGPYGGVASTSPSGATMGMFQGLTVSQNQPVTAGAGNSSSALPGGMPDPFASAGLSDPFGAGGGNKPAQGLSWMDDAFGAGGSGLGGGNAGGVGSGGGGGMGKPLQASGVQSSGSTMAGFSGLGGTLSSAPPVTVAGGVGMPPPQQKQASGRLSSPVAAGAAPGGGDPFAAFFDAAISGGSGPASSGQQGSPVVAPRVPTTGGNGAGGFMGGAATAGNAGIGGGGFMGGFGAPPTGGSGAGLGNGGGGGGGTIEDQLAKTQNEIAQLTRELGGGGMAAAVGAAATGWGMGGSSALPGGLMGGAGGEQGWMGGGGGGGVSNHGPAQQAQGAGSQDPFAFLGANSQGGQQGNPKGGARSDFDFLR